MTETEKNVERIMKETEREKLIVGGNFNARISSELSILGTRRSRWKTSKGIKK